MLLSSTLIPKCNNVSFLLATHLLQYVYNEFKLCCRSSCDCPTITISSEKSKIIIHESYKVIPQSTLSCKYSSIYIMNTVNGVGRIRLCLSRSNWFIKKYELECFIHDLTVLFINLKNRKCLTIQSILNSLYQRERVGTAWNVLIRSPNAIDSIDASPMILLTRLCNTHIYCTVTFVKDKLCIRHNIIFINMVIMVNQMQSPALLVRPEINNCQFSQMNSDYRITAYLMIGNI